jgi:hypothetical protein
MDSTVGADALAALSTQPFFRVASDPYPDFDAAEVTASSSITTGGKRYRLVWARGVDAVSSVLMQQSTANEYILDTAAASLSEWVITLPTRRFYRTATTAAAPFSLTAASPECEVFELHPFDREERAPSRGGIDFGVPPPAPTPAIFCNAATVVWLQNGARHMAPLLGSDNLVGSIETGRVGDTFQNGWARFVYVGAGRPAVAPSMLSLATSTATDLATGATTTGAFRVMGLPATGFLVRSFSNGTLTCSSTACQGNYASAFAHKAERAIVAAP